MKMICQKETIQRSMTHRDQDCQSWKMIRRIWKKNLEHIDSQILHNCEHSSVVQNALIETRRSLEFFEIEKEMKMNETWRPTIRDSTRLSRRHSTFGKSATRRLIGRKDNWSNEKIKKKTGGEPKSWIIDQDLPFHIDICPVLCAEFSYELHFFTAFAVSRLYRHTHN